MTTTVAVEGHAIATELRFIPITQLFDSALNPRRRIDDAKIRDLASSIKAHGLIEPLVVRVRASGGFEIVAGHRRVKAAQVAGVETVPCLVRRFSDAEAVEVMVIENLQREDVHPLDEAFGYKRLLEMGGAPAYDVGTIAAKVGRDESYVYKRLRLTHLIERAQQAFVDDKLHIGHAREIARLTDDQQTRTLQVMGLVKGGTSEEPDEYFADDDDVTWSVARLRRWIEDTFHLALHSAPFKKDDAALVPAAGPCTSCPKRTGSNPMLFDDVKKDDTCTDPTCFSGKLDAHLARRKTELAAKHANLIQISTSYDFYGKEAKEHGAAGVLPSKGYVDAKKGDAGAVPAVIVHADFGREKLGKLVYVKPKSKEQSKGSDYNPRTGLSKAQEEKKRLEKLTSQRVLSAILAAAPTTLDTLIVRDVILPRLADDASPHSKAERTYWTTELGVDPDDLDDAVLTPKQLSKAILLTTLWPCVFGYNGDAALHKAAECYGVDVKAIAAAVKAEVQTKARAKSGTTTKKTAKGRRPS